MKRLSRIEIIRKNADDVIPLVSKPSRFCLRESDAPHG